MRLELHRVVWEVVGANSFYTLIFGRIGGLNTEKM
jgi:hypothetical protein